MMTGANVFLTGAPGSGKTYVLNQFVKRAERAGKQVAVTASTGIAASHLGGSTIHSWSGLGILDDLSKDDIKRLSGNDKLLKRYNSTDILVIDEISMLHGHRLDMVNRLAKILRSSEAPFGGMQVILVGDFYQLPPISRGTSVLDFVHRSETWIELNLNICYLTEQHRQTNSDGLLLFLEAMRSGTLDDDIFETIKDRIHKIPSEGTVITRLYSHNIDVDSINEKYLRDIPTEMKKYTIQSKGSKSKVEQLLKSLLVSEDIYLKTGAEMMFVANNFSEGFVNGSRGQIINFDGSTPVVRLNNSRIIKVQTHTWTLMEDGRMRAEIIQLPIRLAWAITIHKSQGMSLDSAQIDLSRAFTPGMGYVALSRVRSLEGLYINGLNNMAFVMHPEVHVLDNDLRLSSDLLASKTHDISHEKTIKVSKTVEQTDQMLLEKLKAWRLTRSRSDKVPPYIVAHNTTLEYLAGLGESLTERELLAVPGFSIRKIDKFGTEVLAIISSHYNDH